MERSSSSSSSSCDKVWNLGLPYPTFTLANDDKPYLITVSDDHSVKVKNVDWISKLPDDVLLIILSRLSTEEAIRTSVVSKRWEHVWNQMSHLVFDMRKNIINSNNTLDGSNPVATLITQVINNHRGHLESCVIIHVPYQGGNGMLNSWIRLLSCVKRTKVLTLRYHYGTWDRKFKTFNFSPDSLSHPSLMSLSLHSYFLESSHPLRNCSNLRTLKLLSIVAPEIGVFNRVLASCPCLEVLVLGICCFKKSRVPLKIENKKLKLLQVSSLERIDAIEVSTTSLDILAIIDICCRRDDLSLQSPQLQFNRNFWVLGPYVPHISYNISEEKSIGNEEFVNTIYGELLRPFANLYVALSVSVDLMNPTEVERLRQVLGLWTRKILELEIIFKDNNGPREENKSWDKKLWEDNNKKDPFPNAKFRVDTVWMYNFSGSEEEFALMTCLIRQGTVVEKMMIKTSTFPARKRLKIEAAVAKLQALQTKLTIKCF
ncbi:F-box and Leucine Rich Repeat domains containing protein [Arabidopsis thaliana]|uniref:F-box protein At1g80960 n=1 Tax=Arabidopsis thaliana TaxID=3702 RepID=FB93_ARATH|nr:F-box and Leucine Rich Repeat domains containing protein [Arabidopsis thaliana]NP_178211.3 F-box and Leucine Rich Repeat domains containing protein [Arabidopsis thaliana]NP_974194.1 F-box and Leucine Rich Repeat domains containing protein [Arabidopsis thaliana]Q9SAG4.3 RecName: Full=F-box protein At1g80960 [Arabidopsis thaliana]ABP88122.1 At1g80960 [Arabidopsis thaliana]AEE36472.1 F-box and Leucine Rich Repeat domains containing protein [Arabidopsis thaliana]AEE36473.1 F-box and Leucine Ri|eukprot:NP_001319434.1 F-box and Leucine Rich Repeat domains containing protein [Arabidopsis thaliana]